MLVVRSAAPALLFFLAAALAAACTQGMSRPPGGGGDAGPGGGCMPGELTCSGRTTVARCDSSGMPTPIEECTGDLVCAPGLGCAACVPGERRCEGGDLVLECDAAGANWDTVEACPADLVCRGAGRATMCVNACALAAEERSNIGCEYWAVDLDNEYAPPMFGIENDAAGAQFGVAIANPSDVTVVVRVELNDGMPGGAVAARQIFMGTCPPRGVLEIPLPKREVDGSTDAGHDDGPGTFVSSRAFRITTNFPVVAYQFNPIEQQFSNDASLLIPTTGLDTHYRVLGWPTANPISFGGIAGIPDSSYITVVGVHEATDVTVHLTHAILGGGGVPATAAGGTVTYRLGPFDVLNLETEGAPGDLTGSWIESTFPVAVFSGGERGSAPYSRDDVPAPPGGWPESTCCTDHLEEQVFPTSAWGQDFVVTRSPQRSSSPTYAEPDIYRVIADRERTTITTNLPGFATMTLEPGEWTQFWADHSFVMRADHPVSIEQILVSQQFIPATRSGHGGDPSMILFPPYQQYREEYVFLTPSTFTADYVVLAAPVGITVLLDGVDVRGDEFRPLCHYAMAGEIEGTMYEAITCPVEDGPHRVEGTEGFGLMVYGYYNVGSYGYAGGSDLERINLF